MEFFEVEQGKEYQRVGKGSWGSVFLEDTENLKKIKFSKSNRAGGLETLCSISLSRKEKDRWVLYHYQKGKGVRDISPSPNAVGEIMEKALYSVDESTSTENWGSQRHISKIFKDSIHGSEFVGDLKRLLLRKCYPIIALLDLDAEKIPSCLSAGFRKQTIPECCERIYGLSSKGIVREFSKAIFSEVIYNHYLVLRYFAASSATSLKGDVNRIQRILQMRDEWLEPTNQVMNSYLDILSKYGPDRKVRLIESVGGIHVMFMASDAIHMWGRVKEHVPGFQYPIRQDTWKGIHDALIPPNDIATQIINEKNKQAQKKQRKIPRKDLNLLQEIHGTHINGYEIRVPKSQEDLSQWGEEMHNCISGYWFWHESGVKTIFGVFQDGKIIHGISILKDGSLEQFRGLRNKLASLEIQMPIIEFLKGKGIMDPTSGPDYYDPGPMDPFVGVPAPLENRPENQIDPFADA